MNLAVILLVIPLVIAIGVFVWRLSRVPDSLPPYGYHCATRPSKELIEELKDLPGIQDLGITDEYGLKKATEEAK